MNCVITIRSNVITKRGYVITIRSSVITKRGYVITIRSSVITKRGYVITIRSNVITKRGAYYNKEGPATPVIGGGLPVSPSIGGVITQKWGVNPINKIF